MIGRVQDVMSAAIVVGAAETAGASSPAAPSAHAANMAGSVGDGRASAQDTAMQKAALKRVVEDKQAAEEADPQRVREESEKKMDENSVSLMTKELNELMSRINCNLQFRYHKEVDIMSVRMLDKSTGELIKEVPPEEMVKSIAKAREWIGAFLDRNA
ncbi:MAG: flagellar protein FlaG [Schwartzia sp. (in: firmicutes)]